MRRLAAILRLRLQSLLMRPRLERELDEELRYHVEREIEFNIAAGMDPADARRQALLEFEGVELRREQCRDMRGMNPLDHLLFDFRFALRQLLKAPGFAAAAIFLPAMGICAAAAIFTFVDAALVQPLPYPDPERLVGVYEQSVTFQRNNLSYQDWVDWKASTQTLESLDIYRGSGFILQGTEGAEPASAGRVSAGFFRTLGVKPALGHDFEPGDERPGAPRRVILSHRVWKSRYAADPAIIGRKLILDDQPFEVIGVLPREFHFALVNAADYWATADGTQPCEMRRGCHNFNGVARLKPEVSLEAALADTRAIAKRLEEQYPDSNRGMGANVVPLDEVILGNLRPLLGILLGGAILLLVIACVNVSSLLLVRSEGRRREMAVRSALGAGRPRLLRQLVTEGLLLAGASTGLGVMFAGWAVTLLEKLIPERMRALMPFFDTMALNGRVLLFVLLTGLIALALFTAIPAVALRFGAIRDGLVEGARGTAGLSWRRLGARLVAAELAMATVLLVCAGLLAQSLHRILDVPLGFEPVGLATFAANAPRTTYDSDAKTAQLGRRVVDELEALPAVESAALTSRLPITGNGNTMWIRFQGKPYSGEHNEVNFREVTPGFFKTIGATVLRGRGLTAADAAGKQRVTVINESFARRYFPGEDPIGQQFGDTSLSPDSLRQIVGVVSDVRESSLDEEIWPAEYLPFDQSPERFFHVVVRSRSGHGVLPSAVNVVRGIDHGIATLDPGEMTQRIDNSPAAYLRRSSALLVGVFATLALLLGVVGLYGVVAYSVGQRTREIGVRMALGAERSSLYGMVLGEAGWLIALGLAFGLAASLAAASLLRGLLFAIQPWDLTTLAAVALVLAVAALVATWLPAHRAASVNPVEALRSE